MTRGQRFSQHAPSAAFCGLDSELSTHSLLPSSWLPAMISTPLHVVTCSFWNSQTARWRRVRRTPCGRSIIEIACRRLWSSLAYSILSTIYTGLFVISSRRCVSRNIVHCRLGWQGRHGSRSHWLTCQHGHLNARGAPCWCANFALYSSGTGLITGDGYAVSHPLVNAFYHETHSRHPDWPFPGTRGQLDILLSAWVIISDVMIDHGGWAGFAFGVETWISPIGASMSKRLTGTYWPCLDRCIARTSTSIPRDTFRRLPFTVSRGDVGPPV